MAVLLSVTWAKYIVNFLDFPAIRSNENAWILVVVGIIMLVLVLFVSLS